MPVPEVAVWIVTYNHAPFIAKAIESVLMQKTDFDFRIFIGEDCSTDRTGEICKEYQAKYPEKIDLKQHRSNIGSVPNGIDTYLRCFRSEADYIALLEGDDYWTDPYKLQKQVNILKSNPEYAICFHKVNIVDSYGNIISNSTKSHKKNRFTLIELLKGDITLNTLSCVFKKNFKHLPEWFQDVMPGDWTLHVLNAQFGDLYFIDDVMGCYRVHSQGIWSYQSRIENHKKILNTYDLIDDHLDYNFSKYIRTVKIEREMDYLSLLLKRYKWKQFCKSFIIFFITYPKSINNMLYYISKQFLIHKLPFLKKLKLKDSRILS